MYGISLLFMIKKNYNASFVENGVGYLHNTDFLRERWEPRRKAFRNEVQE